MYHNSSHIPTLMHARTSTHAILTTFNRLKHLAEALVPIVLMCGSRDHLHDMTTGPTIRKRLIYRPKTCNDI